MTGHLPSPPRAWTAEELRRDQAWIQRLSEAEVAGFEAGLAHAKGVAKDWLDMTAEDFPLDDAALGALQRAFASTQTGFGMCLLKGFPVDRWSAEDARLVHWGVGLHVGVARPQNRASQVMNDVRDEGGSYKVKGGRGYNTNAGLDFHGDSCDVVALLCLKGAKSGGTSLVCSTMSVCEEIARVRPDLIPVLKAPFHHSYQGAGDPDKPPFYACPILGDHPLYFAFRANRKNVVAAQRDFDEVPRLTAAQQEALDLLDRLLPDPRFCFSMQLEPGDMQLLNNYVVLHSRTDFEDHAEPERKRHLLRLWLAIPESQPLPDQWETYFGDVRAGSVRGGVRGSELTAAYLDFEARQAKARGMLLKPQWRAGATPGEARQAGMVSAD
jgi:hypothetical protein